jgi:hypothetical protein
MRSLSALHDVECLVVVGEREEIESLHILHDKLGSASLVGHGKRQLQQVVLDGACIASHVDEVVESSAAPKGHHHILIEARTRRVQYGNDALPSESVTYLLYLILSAAEQHLVIGVVMPRILHSLFTYLNAYDF